MAYKNEVEKCVKGKIEKDFFGYKISLMQGVTVVEGVKALLSCDTDIIRVRLKNCIAVLSGQGLAIAECQLSQITVCGKIDCVAFE